MMRCHKCGYNSFDHNLTCPKCHKDLTAVRRILNLTVPAPGKVNFFQISTERSVFAEPILGGGGPSYGDAPAVQGLADEPLKGFESSFPPVAPTAAAAMSAPIMAGLTGLPAVDDSDDIDDIVPVDFSDPQAAPAAPAPDLADYITQAPAADDDEIEIEIDAEADDSQAIPAANTFMVSPDPVGEAPQAAPPVPPQALDAMAQIKSALTQTGDLSLAAQAAVPAGAPPEEPDYIEPAEAEFPVGDFGAAPQDDQAAAEYEFPVGDFGAAPQDDQAAAEYEFPVGDFGAAPQDDQPEVGDFDFPVGDFGAAPQDGQPAAEVEFPVGDFGAAPQDDGAVDDFDLPDGDFGAAPQDDGAVGDFDFPVGDFGAAPQDAGETAAAGNDVFVETEAGGGAFTAPAAVPGVPVDSLDGQAADDTVSSPQKPPKDDDGDLASMVGDLNLDDLDNEL